jgi:hypothetical protein
MASEDADHGEAQYTAMARSDATFGSFRGIAYENMIVTKVAERNERLVEFDCPL